jgi:hypothetical protein
MQFLAATPCLPEPPGSQVLSGPRTPARHLLPPHRGSGALGKRGKRRWESTREVCLPPPGAGGESLREDGAVGTEEAVFEVGPGHGHTPGEQIGGLTLEPVEELAGCVRVWIVGAGLAATAGEGCGRHARQGGVVSHWTIFRSNVKAPTSYSNNCVFEAAALGHIVKVLLIPFQLPCRRLALEDVQVVYM